MDFESNSVANRNTVGSDRVDHKILSGSSLVMDLGSDLTSESGSKFVVNRTTAGLKDIEEIELKLNLKLKLKLKVILIQTYLLVLGSDLTLVFGSNLQL